MELSKKSWHFFMHRLVFGDDAKEPKNLCPYFWKSIFLGTFIILIFLPLAIPFILVRAVWTQFDKEEAPPSVFESGLWSEYSLMTVMFNAAVLMLYSMVAMWFVKIMRNEKGEMLIDWRHGMGTIGWLIVLGVIYHFSRKAYLKKKESRPYVYKESKPSVFWEVIKAWYHRNCPMIKWK